MNNSSTQEYSWDHVYNDLSRITNKEDYIVDKENVGYSDDGKIVALTNDFKQINYSPTTIALQQLFAKAKMPTRYFNTLHEREQHDLIKTHVNYNMKLKDEDKSVLVRVADIDDDRKARAILSEKYSPLSNIKLVQAIQNEISDDYYISEYKHDLNTMMMRLISRNNKNIVEVEKGDELATGMIVMNSETGTAGLRVAPTVLRLVCSNGMTAWKTLGDNKKLYYKRHVGLSPDEMNQFVAQAIQAAKNNAFEQAQKLKVTKDMKVEDGLSKIKSILNSPNINKSFVNKVENIWQSEWGSEGTMYAVINSITRSARDINTQDKILVEGVVGDYLNELKVA